ncbi:MAG TPA: hypothetical protein VFV97_15455 [Rhodanobacteraceae bacterium]|nr:hypothetical protein [Rhodanobacteraceae bacterium]
MRLVLRRFVTPRDGGIEVALWSPARVRPLARPQVRRCLRLFTRMRERIRERETALED